MTVGSVVDCHEGVAIYSTVLTASVELTHKSWNNVCVRLLVRVCHACITVGSEIHFIGVVPVWV